MQPAQLTILGVGLLGGSIGLAVRSAVPSCRIIGYGHRAQTLQRAKEIGAIDEAQTDPAKSVAGSDLIILCTPVGLFEPLLKQIVGAIKPGSVLTDVGSTKRSIVKLSQSILPDSIDFVASHPIAGSEKRGVEFARADLFRNRLCILTPGSKTKAASLEKVEKFWQLLGMNTVRLSPEEHDHRLADVSHLPHLVAAALVAIQQDQSLNLSGKGFLDATRIAGGDGGLWRDIFLDNADNLRQGVARLQDEIAKVMAMLQPGNEKKLQEWLDAAAARRQKLVDQKIRELNQD